MGDRRDDDDILPAPDGALFLTWNMKRLWPYSRKPAPPCQVKSP